MGAWHWGIGRGLQGKWNNSSCIDGQDQATTTIGEPDQWHGWLLAVVITHLSLTNLLMVGLG